jgi:hypothetical protein
VVEGIHRHSLHPIPENRGFPYIPKRRTIHTDGLQRAFVARTDTGEPMNRLRTRLTSIPALFLLAAWSTADAAGQQGSLSDQIVGAWTYVSVDTVRQDGSRVAMYGADPQGVVIFDASGHYVLLNARADLPRFASNNRVQGTPEEYKAVVLGSIAHFGTYTVNEADKTITFRIHTSTFANWDGVEQKRPFSLVGDVLKWTTPNASGGGTGEIVLKRAK